MEVNEVFVEFVSKEDLCPSVEYLTVSFDHEFKIKTTQDSFENVEFYAELDVDFFLLQPMRKIDRKEEKKEILCADDNNKKGIKLSFEKGKA